MNNLDKFLISKYMSICTDHAMDKTNRLVIDHTFGNGYF